ncbi:Sodium/calcium exchanger protein-domain-containing protein [Melanogaster broomeanus]|nr:Sodium/calcium exchanger protein-domain-containing protein [Melanogaster broomeanus]
MSSTNAKSLFVACLIINCVLWSQGRYAQPIFEYQLSRSEPGETTLWKRAAFADLSADPTLGDAQCRPLAFELESDQCIHVRDECPPSDTFLSIPYLHIYFCAEPQVRPLVFVGLLVWLLLLFSTLGISASDFFTPNLATIAQFLGLNENVAGVTFLAFGNASPDVFSTFSAMRAHSGGLAIGELLGAASFIVSCVVGSMCIIRPFRVDRIPFLRDVGFFTVAVGIVLLILRDGKILSWEAAMLVLFYAVYAVTVVISSWWENRREKRQRLEALIRTEYMNDVQPYLAEPYTDSRNLTVDIASPIPVRARASSSTITPRIGVQTQLPPHVPSHSRTPSPISTPSHLTQMPSFSLVGALEFRQVVTSLQNQAAGSSLNIFDSPITPYAGGHYHRHQRSGSRSPSVGVAPEVGSWDAALGLPLDDRSPRLLRSSIGGDRTREDAVPIGSPEEEPPLSIPTIPSISQTPASPSESDASTEVERRITPTRGQRLWHVLARTWHILFPSLHHFRSKPITGQIVALFAAPAVMALTLTLPVVVIPYGHDGAHEEKIHQAHETRLVDFEEEGVERALMAENEVQKDLHEVNFNKWLMAAQCVLGPLFCVGVLFNGTKHIQWLLAGTAVGGVAVALLVLVFASEGSHPTSRMARCCMGFFVAIIWIMAIADEVVNVLKTFGLIFGLSDAIIGLTIFAVGNSLADLVANMSVAVFAPRMGFSACFGGPMVNILLGVGISGSYVINNTGHAYELAFTPTLITSVVGLLMLLLTTLFVVPMNGYFLSRRWGIFLLLAYVVLMTANLFVELSYE